MQQRRRQGGLECGSAGVDGIKSAMNGAPTAGGVRRLSIVREQTCFTRDESRRLERNVGRISVSKTEARSRQANARLEGQWELSRAHDRLTALGSCGKEAPSRFWRTTAGLPRCLAQDVGLIQTSRLYWQRCHASHPEYDYWKLAAHLPFQFWNMVLTAILD